MGLVEELKFIWYAIGWILPVFIRDFSAIMDYLLSKPQSWQSDATLHGKTVIVTGGNRGLGLETVKELHLRGARVIIACRDTKTGHEEAAKLNAEKVNGLNSTEPSVIVKFIDLASLTSIRRFAQEVLKEEEGIHILVNNAGAISYNKSKTEDGFERTFGINHLGPFLLTVLLLDRLKKSAPSRVVTITSSAHLFAKLDLQDVYADGRYYPGKAYVDSKMANVLFTRELARRTEGSGVTTYSVHPGTCKTQTVEDYVMQSNYRPILKLIIFLFYKSPREGVKSIIYCCIDKGVEKESGRYYSGCRRMRPSVAALNDTCAEALWQLSEELTSVKLK